MGDIYFKMANLDPCAKQLATSETKLLESLNDIIKDTILKDKFWETANSLTKAQWEKMTQWTGFHKQEPNPQN